MTISQKRIDLGQDHYGPLHSLLFEGNRFSRVYALLDGASIDGLPELLDGSDLPHGCLFEGALIEELARAAPYLVHLHPYNPLTQRILVQGWGAHWGVFILSESSLDLLKKHFQKCLEAVDVRGESLIFRFYDPRVLHAYLSSADMSEAGAFFGPSDSFFAESEDGFECVIYSLLHEEAKFVDHQFDSPSGKNVVVHPERIEKLNEASESVQRHRVFEYVRSHPSLDFSKMEKDSIDAFVGSGIEKAADYGIFEEDLTRCFIGFMLEYGEGFDEDARSPWAHSILQNNEISASEKIGQLLAAAPNGQTCGVDSPASGCRDCEKDGTGNLG